MTVCQACGGEDFEEVSGLYYCSECNTQSQDVRLEEVDEQFGDNCFRRSSGRVRRRETTEEGEKKRPYRTNELFNIILVNQVEALILLGASPALRSTVCRLWMEFLGKSEAAFKGADSEDEKVPRVGVLNRWSDLKTAEELLSSGLSEEKQRKRVRRALFASGIRTRVLERPYRKAEKLRRRGAPLKVPLLDSEYDTSGSDDDVDNFDLDLTSSIAKEQLRKAKERGEDIHSKRITREQRTTLVTMRKLLCFLYLGVLLDGDPILLPDILRWATDGHLPYLHVIGLLPPDVFLWEHQWRVFVHYTLPSLEDVCWEAGHLAEFLGVRDSLRPADPMPVVTRLLVDFNLPLGLLDVCRRIQEVDPGFALRSNSSSKEGRQGKGRPGTVPGLTPTCEVRAAAILLLVLKLVFVLDDKKETAVSRAAKSLGQLCADANLFCWDQWVQHTTSKVCLLRSCCYLFKPDDTTVVRNINLLVRNPAYVEGRSSAYSAGLRDGLCKSFRSLHKKDLPWRQVPSSSFPLTTATDFFVKDAEVSPGLREVLEEDFLRKDVTYLTRDREAIAQLGIWSSLHEHTQLLEIRRMCEDFWVFRQPPAERMKYKQHVQPHLPKVFVWLLELFSTLLHCEPKTLYNEVAILEGILLRRKVRISRETFY